MSERAVAIHDDWVHRVPLMDPEACARALTGFEAMRERWYSCDGGRFAVFGLPLYQAAPELARYRSCAREDNALLWKAFGPLYAAVNAALGRYVGATIRFLDGFAIPGFHVFGVQENGRVAPGAPHFDVAAFESGLLATEDMERGYNLSFTLPLSLPEGGGGLELWDFCHDDAGPHHSAADFAESGSGDVSRYYVEYTVGVLHVFSGCRLHRIAGTRAGADTRPRVTLQGHCVRYRKQWVAYW